MNLLFQLLIGFSSICLFVFCDYTITRWVEEIPSDGYVNWRLLAMILPGPLGLVAFGFLGARMGLAAASVFINTGTVAGGVIVGVLLRGEQLTLYQKIGVVCGSVGILLINMGKSEPVVPGP